MTANESARLTATFERHPVAAFFAIALGATWLVWIPVALDVVAGPPMAFIVAGGFGPVIAGAVVTKATGGSVRSWLAGMFRRGIGLRWYLVALVLPLAVVAGSTVVLVVLGRPLDWSVVPGRIGGYIVAVAITFLFGGGQEELGWRGFALPRLQRAYGPMTASVAIGAVWAVWHLPLFAVSGTMQSQISFFAYAPAVVAMSVMLTWLYNESAGCILPAMVFHAGLNNTGSLLPASAASITGDLSRQLVLGEVAVIVTLGVVVVLVVGRSLGAGAATIEGDSTAKRREVRASD